MAARVPASERTSQRLRELLEGLGEGDASSQVIRLAVRKIVEEALEAEVRDVLGRERYEPTAYRRGGGPNGGGASFSAWLHSVAMHSTLATPVCCSCARCGAEVRVGIIAFDQLWTRSAARRSLAREQQPVYCSRRCAFAGWYAQRGRPLRRERRAKVAPKDPNSSASRVNL